MDCMDTTGDSRRRSFTVLPILSHVTLSRNGLETESMSSSLMDKMSSFEKHLQGQHDRVKSLCTDLQRVRDERGSATLRLPE